MDRWGQTARGAVPCCTRALEGHKAIRPEPFGPVYGFHSSRPLADEHPGPVVVHVRGEAGWIGNHENGDGRGAIKRCRVILVRCSPKQRWGTTPDERKPAKASIASATISLGVTTASRKFASSDAKASRAPGSADVIRSRRASWGLA